MTRKEMMGTGNGSLAWQAQTFRLDGISKAPSRHEVLDQYILARNGLCHCLACRASLHQARDTYILRRGMPAKSAIDPDAMLDPLENQVICSATPRRREYSLCREADILQDIDNEIAIRLRQRRHPSLHLRKRELRILLP